MRIRKKELIQELHKDKKEREVSISHLLHCIEVKDKEAGNSVNYFLEDIDFKVITYKYNQWKNKGKEVKSVEEFSNFLNEIATSKHLLCESFSSSSWKSNTGHLRFKSEEIKTAEEWFLLGKLTEQEKQKLLTMENQRVDLVRWHGISISEKVYYSLENLNYIKSSYLNQVEAQIEVKNFPSKGCC